MSWHVSQEAWQAYAAGTLDPATETSVETHVTGCPQCRHAARSLVDTQEIWASVQASVRRPRHPWPLRALARLGVPEADLVVIGASEALGLIAAVTVGAALASALITGLAGIRQELVFMVLVPLVPVLAVVAAFDATDSLRDLTIAAPFSKLRIALLRSVAALVIAVPVTMAIGYAVPNLEHLAFLWLLPSLGLMLATLVLLTWLEPWLSAGAVSTGWVAVTVIVRSADALTTAPMQLAFAAASGVLTAVLVLRTTTFKLAGGQG